ncbi:splicing factor 1 [Tribolium madens]|uniref:splicing factor 1 n=1 Tax=Tribolium madens TaxID=41895 RepID=UPI001CF71E09|nr:splicing factor 1 [Tribolium madens]
MGSSRHRDRSRERDRDRRDRDRDRDRRDRRKSSRDRHRDRDRDRRERDRSREKRREKTPEPDGEKLIADTLATIAATRNFAALVAPKPEPDTNSNQSNGSQEEDGTTRKRKKRSRWAGGEHDKIFIPGMPTILPSGLDKNQEQAYLLQLQIEEVSRKLRSGDLGIPPNPEDRSPSPEPIYSSDGKRLNTREFRTRKKLEEERHSLILKMQQINPDFKPPMDYNCRPPVVRVSDKVMIPQEEHPEINFVGLLIGPRGNTLKTMEKETGAKIIIRGKGSVKEGKVGRKDGQPLPGEDEPLHAYITATNPECVKKAVERIKEVIRQGVEVPENQNDLRRMQLRELAQLNGTLRENDGMRCNNCGATDHKSWLCPDKPNVTNNIVCSSCGAAGHIARDCRQKRPGAGGPPVPGEKNKIDEEYMSLMAELGEAPPPDAVTTTTTTSTTTTRKSSFNLFDSPMTPRPLMPPPMPTQTAILNSMAPPPWATVAQNMTWQPGPPGIMPPPPPPGASSPPQMMQWMGANNQPPPPGATATNGSMPWQAAAFTWPPGSCPPPPPPGIDVNSLLTTPPPPPPS